MQSGYVIRFDGNPKPLQGLTKEMIRRAPSGPVTSYPFTMFEDEARKIFVPGRLIEEVDLNTPPIDEFQIELPPGGRSLAFGAIGSVRVTKPFSESEFGRRIVTLNTPDGPLDVIQAISKIRPDYVTLEALKRDWTYAIETKSLPPEVLRKALSLSKGFDEKSHEDRLAIVRFFIDAEMFGQAQQELDRMEGDFPDLTKRINELRLQVRQLRALEFLNEFRSRLNAGQYRLVYNRLGQFPREDISETTLQELEKMGREHEEAVEKMDRVRAGLSRLQAELDEEPLLKRFRDIRSVIDRKLSRHNLERLTPFLQNLDDDQWQAEEKLSIACSAWVAGPALAVTDPETAIAFWDARDLIRAYLRTTNPNRQQEIYQELMRLENIGPEIIASIVRILGPAYETPLYREGSPISMTTSNLENAVPYKVLLPVEYSPERSYPAVLSLPSAGVPPVAELGWWAGTTLAGPAHRNGFITIVPEVPEGGDSLSHNLILEVLRDARFQFAIDADRVFLAGHGTGADTAIDLGLSHPTPFAGLISIGGQFNDYANHYWKNSEFLPAYFVQGELDGNLFEANASVMTRMIKYGHDVTLVQYKQRGQEDYREELPHIIDWMRFHPRREPPQELEFVTMRPEDTRFEWLEFAGLPPSITQPRLSRSGQPIPATPMPIEATITGGNNLYLKLGADSVTVWLSPENVNFDERVRIRWRGRTRFNEFPERDVETMLQRLQRTGDRSRLYWMRVDL